MAIKYDYLQEKLTEAVNALKTEVDKADNESDMDDLEALAINLIQAIPITLIQKDFYLRSDIRARLAEENRTDTKKINELMRYIHEEDAVYIGDYAILNIDDCIDEFEAKLEQ